jgi:hypothetical protein
MSLNLWKTGEQPTSYNPLPIGWGNSIYVKQYTDYTFSFRAKSDTNATLHIEDDGTASVIKDFFLTSEFKIYEFSWLQKTNFKIYFYDLHSKGDIIIQDIQLVQKPLPKLTINGIDGFGKVLMGDGSLTTMSNFDGKVSGDGIGNVGKGLSIVSNSLQSPNGTWAELGNVHYDVIDALDGTLFADSHGGTGNIVQNLFSFNILDILEKKFSPSVWQGKTSIADKVDIAKMLVKSIVVKWYGVGSSPLGNKANVKWWAGDWYDIGSHTANTVSLVGNTISGGNTALAIQSDGFTHLLAHAEPSNGTIASTISTDYVELVLEFNQSAIVDSKWTLHPNAKVIDNETLELNATGNFQTSNLQIAVKGGETFSFNIETSSGGYMQVNAKDSTGTDIGEYLVSAGVDKTITTPSNAVKLMIILSNNTGAGKFTFKKPMLNLGSIRAPYEKKRGTDSKMVLPTVKKNLFDGKLESGYIATNGQKGDSSISVRSVNYLAVKGNTLYTLKNFNRVSNGTFLWAFYNVNNVFISYGSVSSKDIVTFTTPSDCSYVRFGFDGGLLTDLFQLEQSTYATPYEPYAVQVNKKPMRYVPKKNYMPLLDATRYSEIGTGNNNTVVNNKLAVTNYSGATAGKGVIVDVIPNKTYTFSAIVEANLEGKKGYITIGYSATGSELLMAIDVVGKYSTLIMPTQNKIYIRFTSVSSIGLGSPVYFSDMQLEEGTTATQYEPYQLVLPRAKSGLRFEGDSHVQLPSMTMDSIEIDCLIDTGTTGQIINAETGLTNGYMYYNGFFGAGFSKRVVNGVDGGAVTTGSRIKIKVVTNTPFTDNVNIFSNSVGAEKVKATLYGITCYLNGQVVAEYDFENPNNIVGDKVLPNAKNLVPSFDSVKDRGLVMDGTNHYVQLPSMTMDSIEVEALIDSVQKSGFPCLFDATKTDHVTNGQYLYEHDMKGFSELRIDDAITPFVPSIIPRGRRVKVKALATVPFTDNVNIFSNFVGGDNLQGTLYNVTCYLNGQVVATYDMNQLQSLAKGGAIVQDIPTWNLHANADVLGKDVLRLEPNSNHQESTIKIPITKGKTYLLGGKSDIETNFVFYDDNDNYVGEYIVESGQGAGSYTPPISASKCMVRLWNRTVIKPYTFIKPQLYELNGKEAQLMGKPTPLRKPSKRTLYNKR